MDMAEKDDTEGRCPACRTPYDKERIVGMTVSSDRLAEINYEKKQKSQKAKSKTSEGRKHLSTVRVIQRNLVYIVGIPANLADEETLQRKEFFGQYGKILKVSITRTAGAAQHSSNNSCSVYITYSKNEEAIRCIQVVNGYVLDGRPLRACFGTTKYCHAWLRNMPCGNPDCLYLHDAGTQEDTFTKDEAISTCASKFQHSPGSSLNNFHQRSGSFLPPPIDNLCSNNTIPLSKPLVKPVIHSAGVYSKSSLLNGDTGKSGGLPPAASWGVRVTSGVSLATNTEVIQGPAKHKTSMSGSLTSSVGTEAQFTTQTSETDQRVERMVAPRNQRSIANGRLETFPTSKPSNTKDCQVDDRHVEASLEPTAVLKGSLCESSRSCTSNEIARGIIPLPCSLDSSGFCQQVSNPLPNNEDIRHSIVDETTQSSSGRLHHMVDDDTGTSSGSLNGGGNNMISSYQSHAETRPPLEHPSISLQDSLRPSTEAGALGAIPGAASTSQAVPSTDEQPSLSSKSGVKMLTAANIQGRSICPTSSTRLGDLSDLCTHGLVREPIVDVFSVSPTSLSTSPKGEQESYTPQSSGHGEVIESPNLDNGSHNLTLFEKARSQNASTHEELNADEGENSIITDILSLDIGLDDPHASSNLAKLLRGNSDKNAGLSRLFSPWKASSNNESRFSFARMDDSNQDCNHALSLDTSKFWREGNFDPQDIEINQGGHVNRFPNGIALSFSEDSGVLNSHHHLPSSRAMVSRLEENAPPKSPIQRKAPPIPPPGFYPQHVMDRDQYASMVPSPGSAAQYPFLGSSANLNLQQQVAGNSSYADVEFIDPAIMAVSRGKLPLPMTHQISPNYSSNMLAGFSEMDQRLQLLKSRSSNLNQNPMMTVDQSKYSLLQDMALQEAMRNSNGSWGSGWNVANPAAIESGLLGRRGQSSLAEITNSGRVGYLESQYGFLRPFPAHEDTKFQAPNSGRFYNSAYDM
ncbi:uncharacterized protein LOC131245554 isoform X2 [Magnolia sinica]|nr:uncharacterized protein LOC131245554 isoform X2 [Magnolia sinica]